MTKWFGGRQLGFACTLTAVLVSASAFLAGDESNSDRYNPFEFALIGDVPYSPTAGTSPKVQTYPSPDYDALIADINYHTKVLFTAHVGDIKAGDTWCVGGNSKDPGGAANVYTSNLTFFNTFSQAAVYIPGDNEWTDCHRTNNGAYTPTERLAYIRSIFFTSNLSLGQRPIKLTRQSSDAGFELYKENVMWQIGGVLFVGINQPGSNNNHQRNILSSSPLPVDNSEAEYTARNAANLAWVNKGFDAATANPGIIAVVIMQQANPFERFLEAGQGYTRSGYEDFINTLRTRTVAFGKSVVLVNGDTHTIRIDKPLTTLYPGHTAATGSAIQLPTAGTRILNFTRIEVFGPPDVHWVRAIVDPSDPNVFSFAIEGLPGGGHGRGSAKDATDQQ